MLVYGNTDVGLVREINEDAFTYSKISDCLAFAIVCDGMGGYEGGEIAAQKAIEIISDSFSKSLKEGIKNSSIRYLIESAITTANDVIYNIANKTEKLSNMGTTLVLAVINNDTLHIAHIGDSRAYLFRDSQLHRLTVDHSVVQTLLDQGELTEDEAKNHPNKNIITKALGTKKDISADFSEVFLQENDVLLLCSDGLTSFATENDIIETISKGIEKAPD